MGELNVWPNWVSRTLSSSSSSLSSSSSTSSSMSSLPAAAAVDQRRAGAKLGAVTILTSWACLCVCLSINCLVVSSRDTVLTSSRNFMRQLDLATTRARDWEFNVFWCSGTDSYTLLKPVSKRREAEKKVIFEEINQFYYWRQKCWEVPGNSLKYPEVLMIFQCSTWSRTGAVGARMAGMWSTVHSK